jgi:Protein of unknown function (DUF1588)/Protein of unknown function (DUF1592)/Protein of unknown function (DUF1585)/Protein of unknown function (DUF1587)/Protein of unknown function (DUF1595)/Planctomycete cytochrome C
VKHIHFIIWIAYLLAGSPAPAADFRSTLNTHCLECHDSESKKGGLNLSAILRDDIAPHAEVWERVIKQLNTRQMPPIGKPRPDEASYAEVVHALATELDQQPPEPGPVPRFRRLTRVEYQNAVRDLLAVEFDAKAALPADEISHGFDNITVGDLPPALLDRYLTSAQKIARQAMGASDQPEIRTVRVRPDVTQEYHIPGLPLGTRGGVLMPQVFPREGDYDVQIRLQRDRNEQVEGLRGVHELQLLLNREVKATFTIKPAKDQGDEMIDAHLKLRLHIPAGPHDIGVTFLPKGTPVLERLRQPYKASFNLHRHPRLSPAIYQVTVTGPYDAQGPGDTPSRRLIFGNGPADATAILRPLLRRAWRREVTEADLDRFQPFIHQAQTLESGLESALAALLVSREFLFRTTAQHDEAALASQLSFFLWSSLPDNELLSQRPETQTRRLLQDPRAKALVTNFADQWLYLRNLDSITPDTRLFPDFDHNLRESLRTETSLLVEDIIHHDRSVLDLLRTDRTWLDERLAVHYGIPHIHGSRFREVKLEPSWQRGGLLRNGSIQTVTSYATRTSPVIRGHWILKNLLGAEPPPPPPNIPALDGVISETLPIRQRLAKHRESAACASCHNLMDPIGFSLENYDAIGRWHPGADARGGIADGSEFDGVAGLEAVLLKRPELFVTALSEKLLTYALGRGLEPSDAPAIRKIVRRAKEHDWKFSEIIVGITTSVPFDVDFRKPQRYRCHKILRDCPLFPPAAPGKTTPPVPFGGTAQPSVSPSRRSRTAPTSTSADLGWIPGVQAAGYRRPSEGDAAVGLAGVGQLWGAAGGIEIGAKGPLGGIGGSIAIGIAVGRRGP